MKRIIIPLISLFFYMSVPAQNRMQDSIALVAIYNATDGTHWTNHSNWLSGQLNTWYGVTLNSSQRVYRLMLSNNGLTGELSDSLGKLTSLSWLYLNGNALSGSIPDTLGHLLNLSILDLSYNNLSGVVPDQFSNLTNLTSLSLDNNLLNGDFPGISSINGLEYLSATGNLFSFSNLSASGILPGDIDVFQYSPQYTILAIDYTINNGTISVLIDDDQYNRYSWYKNSSLISGVVTRTIIPPGEGAYTCEVTNTNFLGLVLYSETENFQYSALSDSLALVDLYNATNGASWTNNSNWLSGEIETWYGITLDGSSRVEKIELGNNNLEGILPAELSNLSMLVSLKLDGNKLWGNLPVLSRNTLIDTILVYGNRFLFSDLSSSDVAPGDISTYDYQPQDTILTLNYDPYESLLTVEDGADTNNVYKWYLDGSLIDDSTSTIFTNVEGSFNCEITNSVYSGLTIYSDTTDVTFSIASDSVALVHLYNQTNGDQWTNHSNWLTGRVSTWYGITIDSENRVQKVLLPINNLTGTIPGVIGNLSHLTQLNLRSNQLSGTIPDEIEKLTSLTMLRLYGNQLTGSIPDGIENLVNLTELGLHFNQLSGTIPAGITSLTKLQSLKLSNNWLSGTVPSDIGNLTKLTWLSLNNDSLSGTIPASIGNLTLLTGLELDGNSFSGTIPTQIGNLTSLINLSLDHNELTGSIPSQTGNCTHLNYLSLDNNQLNGTIPSGLTNLTQLTDLLLNNNQLSGEIPAEIGNMTSLTNLGLSKNQFSGSLPSELGNLTSLISLSLDSNKFVGDFPLLSGMTYLAELTADKNLFTFSNLISSDVLPTDIDQFVYSPQDTIFGLEYDTITSTLTVLDDEEPGNEFTWFRDTIQLGTTTQTVPLTLEGNYYCKVNNLLFPDLIINSDTFSYSYTLLTDSVTLLALFDSTGGASWSAKTNWGTGQLSSWYGVTLEDGRVSSLVLKSNNLTGSLPPEIGNLTHLSVLQLQNNSLDGVLPDEIGAIDSLTDLRLSNNQLSGTIPGVLGIFTKLNTLYLDNNEFSGSIPAEIGDLINLNYLALNSNQLTGTIPDEMGNLINLQTLNLNMNQLSGSFPTVLGGLVSLQNLQLSSNNFSGTIPSTIGDLVAATTINLSGNDFSGQLPLQIGYLDNLIILNLSGNNFSGTISNNIGYLGSLSNLNISNNAFQFKDIEPVFGWSNCNGFKSSFTYAPQAEIGLVETIHGVIGQPVVVAIEGYVTGDYDAFKWYKDGELLTGKTDTLLVIPAFAQSDSGAYHCVITNSLATALTLTSHDITVEPYTLSVALSIANRSVGSGETECFDAIQDITVAGSGTTVSFLNNSSVTLVAGHSIRFLPGFHAFQGCYADAYITTSGSFCEPPLTIIAGNILNEKSALDNNIPVKNINNIEEKTVKVFPNPNSGNFTVELNNFDLSARVIVVNLQGATVYSSKWLASGLYKISLSGINKGIYLVRIDDGKTLFINKMVIQ